MKIILRICIFFFLIAATLKTKAQSYVFFNDLPRLELGASFNYIIYQGDLVPGKLGDLGKGSPGVGIHAGFDLSPYFALKSSLMFGMIQADESEYGGWRSHRNFKFSSPLTSLDLSFRWFILGKSVYSDPIFGRYRFSPYIFAGPGLVFFKPDNNWDKLDLLYFGYEDRLTGGLSSDALRNYKTNSWFLSAGLGFRVDLSANFRGFVEATWRRTFTDNLDGFHHSVDRIDDSYSNIAIGFSYRILVRDVNKWTCPSGMELLVR